MAGSFWSWRAMRRTDCRAAATLRRWPLLPGTDSSAGIDVDGLQGCCCWQHRNFSLWLPAALPLTDTGALQLTAWCCRRRRTSLPPSRLLLSLNASFNCLALNSGPEVRLVWPQKAQSATTWIKQESSDTCVHANAAGSQHLRCLWSLHFRAGCRRIVRRLCRHCMPWRPDLRPAGGARKCSRHLYQAARPSANGRPTCRKICCRRTVWRHCRPAVPRRLCLPLPTGPPSL